jgi:hypothetical protein
MGEIAVIAHAHRSTANRCHGVITTRPEPAPRAERTNAPLKRSLVSSTTAAQSVRRFPGVDALERSVGRLADQLGKQSCRLG